MKIQILSHFLIFPVLLSTSASILMSCGNKEETSRTDTEKVSVKPTPSEKPDKEKIIGTWKAKVDCTKEKLSISQERKYFQNGSFNDDFLLSAKSNIEGKEAEYSVAVESSSDWSVEDQKMTTKIIDILITPNSLQVGAVKVDLTKTDDKDVQDILNDPNLAKELKELNGRFLKGKSTEYKIIELTENNMKLEEISKEKDLCPKSVQYTRVVD